MTDSPTSGVSIPKRQRDAIVAALRSGVVPRTGLQYLRVGREREIATLVADVDSVASGGSTVRFVVGDFGSGKSFLLGLVRELALASKLVVASADLTPSRRLHSTSSQAQSLYTELMSSLSTKASPNGGAIEAILEQFVNTCRQTARATDDPADAVIRRALESLLPFTGGYDFVEVIAAYWRGFEEGEASLSQAAVRWLRGEFATRTEARQALGVRTIVNDATYYDVLKLFARFCRLSGFGGMLVEIDELTILFRLSHPKGRESNYEKLLTIVNDALQGTSSGIGFLFAGTTETLTDQRRGMYSYKALRTRLPENPFANGNLVDFSGPVIRLGQLTANELYALLVNLRNVFSGGDPSKWLVPDEALLAFMDHCSAQVGDAYFRTPRDTVTAFLNYLAVLEQNPGSDWRTALGDVVVETPNVPGLDDIPEADDRAAEVSQSPKAPGEGDELTNLRL